MTNNEHHNTPENDSLACFTMTCHSCRNECDLVVKFDNEEMLVSGNGCRRGIISAQKYVEKLHEQL